MSVALGIGLIGVRLVSVISVEPFSNVPAPAQIEILKVAPQRI